MPHESTFSKSAVSVCLAAFVCTVLIAKGVTTEEIETVSESTTLQDHGVLLLHAVSKNQVNDTQLPQVIGILSRVGCKTLAETYLRRYKKLLDEKQQKDIKVMKQQETDHIQRMQQAVRIEKNAEVEYKRALAASKSGLSHATTRCLSSVTYFPGGTPNRK